jgi:hypothetical protein
VAQMKTNVSQDEEDTEKEKRGEPQDGDWNCYCEQSDQRSFHRLPLLALLSCQTTFLLIL